MESVIVRWCQVDHHVEELVACFHYLLNKGRDSFLLIISESEHELVKAIRTTLDTIYGGIRRGNLPTGEDSSIARTHNACRIPLRRYHSGTFFEFSSEELVEGLIVSEVLVLHF